MKNSLRRGLFHPSDIKTVGLGKVDSSPSTAPLLSDQSKRSTRASSIASSSHSRASSVSGSFGRSDARRTLSSGDFGRYTEGEDEDYEDVFAKPNGAGTFNSFTPSSTLRDVRKSLNSLGHCN